MAEKIRKFSKSYEFNKKEFEMALVLYELSGKSDIMCMAKSNESFRFCISKQNIAKEDLLMTIALLEDEMQSYSMLGEIELVVGTITEKGFFEIRDMPEIDMEFIEDTEG